MYYYYYILRKIVPWKAVVDKESIQDFCSPPWEGCRGRWSAAFIVVALLTAELRVYSTVNGGSCPLLGTAQHSYNNSVWMETLKVEYLMQTCIKGYDVHTSYCRHTLNILTHCKTCAVVQYPRSSLNHAAPKKASRYHRTYSFSIIRGYTLT